MSVQVTRSDLKRVVVSLDPAVTSGEDSDLTGIIVVARGPHQPETCGLTHCPGHGYVLDDLSTRCTPHEWARAAVAAFDRWEADRIVAEVNNGGDMVGETVHAVRAGVPYTAVRATRGKLTRAEPASALYEQGRVHHLGAFPKLEDQLTTWTPDSGESPDRLDALVWGLTALQLIGAQGQAFLEVWKRDGGTRGTAAAVVDARQVLRERANRRPVCARHQWGPPFGDGERYCNHCGVSSAAGQPVP